MTRLARGSLAPSRSPERTHSEVAEENGEESCQQHFACRTRTGRMAMVFPNCRGCAHHRQQKIQKPGDFQPQHVENTADTPDRSTTRVVKRPHPAVLACTRAGDTHQGAALPP